MYHEPEHFLDRDAAAGRVMAHARLLLKLARRFEAVAPAAFRYAAHVANYKSGTIVIHTDNGAVAAKIRQMSQRLCAELSKSGAECIVMEVRVQPREILRQPIASTLKPISEEACIALRSTTEKLPKGPLRAALDHLLERAAKRG